MSALMMAVVYVITLPLPVLALVALLRTRREDIPKVVQALGRWWHQ